MHLESILLFLFQCDEKIANQSNNWLDNSNLLCYVGADGEQVCIFRSLHIPHIFDVF